MLEPRKGFLFTIVAIATKRAAMEIKATVTDIARTNIRFLRGEASVKMLRFLFLGNENTTSRTSTPYWKMFERYSCLGTLVNGRESIIEARGVRMVSIKDSVRVYSMK